MNHAATQQGIAQNHQRQRDQSLKRSISGLDDAQWKSVAGLAPGQALVSFTSLTRPLMVAVDTAPSHVRVTD
jgi:hypothetical protein